MIALFKYLKGYPTEGGQNLFSIISEGRTRNHGLKLKEARYRLNIRKTFLTVRAVQQWNKLPRELVSAPILDAFKKNLDNHLRDMLSLYPCIEQGIGLDGLISPFQLHFSMRVMAQWLNCNTAVKTLFMT